MADTKELRRLLEEDGKNNIDLDDIRELIDRLEAAEKAVTEAYRRGYATGQEEIAVERDTLRAKIEAMEKQEPVAKIRINSINGNPSVDFIPGHSYLHHNESLYALPGAQAQPAPSEQDESVRKSWARFSNELHRSPDAPYPGMSEAFEQHFSQSFTDRDWRAESGTWAAAWKAAKRHGAQNVPNFVDAYQGAMEEVAIWKKRALEAEDLNRKFIAEINGPTYMGEPAPVVPDKVGVREDKEEEMFSRGSYNEGYDNGWNDCIDAMLAAARERRTSHDL